MHGLENILGVLNIYDISRILDASHKSVCAGMIDFYLCELLEYPSIKNGFKIDIII